MKQRNFAPGIFITVIFLFLLASFQFAFQEYFEGGGLCVSSLEANADSHLRYKSNSFGWPLRYKTVIEEGCVDNRRAQTDWNIPSLLIDTFVMVSFAALAYGISRLWQQQRRGTAP